MAESLFVRSFIWILFFCSVSHPFQIVNFIDAANEETGQTGRTEN